ncbi:hypothetical protein LTR22_025027 [Elasticomyces elasticus]|nr:hypothetical protein LTR22_025027 [Elasticomyces elasticus]
MENTHKFSSGYAPRTPLNYSPALDHAASTGGVKHSPRETTGTLIITGTLSDRGWLSAKKDAGEARDTRAKEREERKAKQARDKLAKESGGKKD